MSNSPAISEAKKRIRQQIAQCKREFPLAWRICASEIVQSRLEALPVFIQARSILLYHALNDEVQTMSLLQRWHDKKKLYLPVVEGDHLQVRRYEPSLMVNGSYGIREPEGMNLTELSVIDLVIVPGVAFDLSGNRLGRGKGYYDRLLPQLNVPKIGIAFSWQLIERLPIEPFDHPLDGVITNEKLFFNI